MQNIEHSWSGRMDIGGIGNTFIVEAEQQLVNAIELFEIGYFDCAYFSLRSAIDLSTTMVYLADTRIKRLIHGQDSWTREIVIQLPVSNVDLWNKQVKTVERMLKFLTGDLWGIEFVERNWPFELNEKAEEKTTLYSRASLFSGGMDSLISTINLMEQKENTLLFGHAGEGLTKNAQTNILNVLNAKYPEIEHTLIDLWMSFPDDYIPEGGNDAKAYEKWLKSFKDSGMLKMAHVAYGFNPGAKLSGNVVEDERVWGATEWGIGYVSPTVGGPEGQAAVSHTDGICIDTSVWLDGTQIMDEGKMVDDELESMYPR